MTTLTRKKVRELAPGEILIVTCANGAEVVSAYQTAAQIRREMAGTEKEIVISKSFNTNTVTIRCRLRGEL